MVSEQDSINWLKDILKIDTTLGNEAEVVDYLNHLLTEAGIETTLVEYALGRTQLIATLEGSMEGGTRVLGLSAHTDVVPAEGEWTYPPFSATEVNGLIYGRGSSDTKSAVIACVITMINLKQSGAPFAGKLKILITAAEESGALGAYQLKELGYADDLDALIVGEATGNRVVIAERGTFWLRFTTKGKAANSANPYLGVNAVEHMRAFLDRFDQEYDYTLYTNELLGIPTGSWDVIEGGDTVSTIPSRCVAEIDIRTIPEQPTQTIVDTIERIKESLGQELEHFDLEYEQLTDQAPTYTDFNDPFVQLAVGVAEEYTGVTQVPLGAFGATDLSAFLGYTNDFPGIILGCGNPYIIHQVNENVVISYYLKLITLYEEIAKRFLQPDTETK